MRDDLLPTVGQPHRLLVQLLGALQVSLAPVDQCQRIQVRGVLRKALDRTFTVLPGEIQLDRVLSQDETQGVQGVCVVRVDFQRQSLYLYVIYTLFTLCIHTSIVSISDSLK